MSGNDLNEMIKAEVLRQLRDDPDSIGRRLAQLEGEVEPKRRPRTRRLAYVIAGSVALSAVLIGVTAAAQQSEQLITFQAGTPARADEINGNFALLKRWIERKVGDVTSTTVVASNVSTSGTVSAASVNVTNGSGDGGRALVPGASDTLVLNSGGDFSGGTDIHGDLRVGNSLSVGGSSLQSLIDSRINALTDARIRSWVRDHCSIHFGFQSNCENERCGANSVPQRTLELSADGACTGMDTDDEQWCAGSWGAQGFSSSNLSNDVFFVRFDCN